MEKIGTNKKVFTYPHQVLSGVALYSRFLQIADEAVAGSKECRDVEPNEPSLALRSL